MRNISGPAAFVLSLILTLILAIAGWAAFAMRGLAIGVLDKNTPDVARWMLNEGKMDMESFSRRANEFSYAFGEISTDKDIAPELRLSRWLVAYHTRRTAGYLATLGYVLLVGAGLSLTVTVLIWMRRPRPALPHPSSLVP
jgi:hypothetical protein